MSKLSKDEYIKQIRIEAERNKQKAEWLLIFCNVAEQDGTLTIEQLEERVSKGRFW